MGKPSSIEQAAKRKLDAFDVLAVFSLAFLAAALALIGMGTLSAPDAAADRMQIAEMDTGAATPNLTAQTGPAAQPPHQRRLRFQLDRTELAHLPPRKDAPIIFKMAEPEVTQSAPIRLAQSIDRTLPFIAEDIPVAFALSEDFSGRSQTPDFIRPSKAALTSTSQLDNIYTLKRGESFSDVLNRAGVNESDRLAAIAALGGIVRLRALQPGSQFTITTETPSLTIYQIAAYSGAVPKLLRRIEYSTGLGSTLTIERGANGQFTTNDDISSLDLRYVAVAGEITDNLFTSAQRVGMQHEAAAKLANLFLYDIDFQREIHNGDKFEAVYEVYYDNRGEVVKTGDIVFGRLTWRGGRENRGYYRYQLADKTDWFDALGESARRFLMKTPIEGARITSGFGKRRHPISGYSKAHKGVDFGARKGTPIMAAGDGVIERANWFSTYGNYVKIKHANGYETAYAHLTGFAKGIKAGARVRQGQIIAYVGSTGASTGPHLHYEVLKGGKQVNPLTLKVADGIKLNGDTLASFTDERNWINRLRPQEPRIQLAQLR